MGGQMMQLLPEGIRHMYVLLFSGIILSFLAFLAQNNLLSVFIWPNSGKKEKIIIIKFIAFSILNWLFTFMLIMGINYLYTNNSVGDIFRSIDSCFNIIFKNILHPFVIWYILLPILIIWGVIICVQYIRYQKIKIPFMKEKKELDNKELQDEIEQIKNNNVEDTPEQARQKMEDSDIDLDLDINHFIKNIEITKFNINTAMGLNNAYMKSKKINDYIMSETTDGYKVVYANKSGFINLKALLMDEGIATNELQPKPMIVEINKRNVSARSLVETRNSLIKEKGRS